jgi:hypothetical protein
VARVAPYSSRRHSQDCLPDRQVKGIAGALHLGIFEQPEKNQFFGNPWIDLYARNIIGILFALFTHYKNSCHPVLILKDHSIFLSFGEGKKWIFTKMPLLRGGGTKESA